MNKNRYQLVFSKVFGMLVPVSEAARSHSNNPLRMRNRLKLKLCIATCVALAYSNFVAADPAGLIPGTQAWRNAVISNATPNSMTITQTAPRAILDWQRLNLNAGELLRFDQQGNRTWSALNRIHDLSPSILNGTVKADGNVYFINTNGIIFGQNAQFNVGSLYAGSLDITDNLFNEGINTKSFEPVFQGLGGFVRVDKGAQITTESGGRVMLFAPEVTNSGVINTLDGQTILAAGKKVYLQSSEDPAGFLVEVDGGGTATNLGKIVAERGNITMMGLAVNQQGTLSATTSVRANGSIRLLAQESVRADNPTLLPTGLRNGVVTLAKDSLTEVAPEYNNKEETIVSQPFKTSNITVEASLVNIDGKVSAKGGNVIVKTDVQGEAAAAQLNSLNPTRIYLGNNAEIDVSGVDATAPMSRNQLEIQLFSEQLKDAPILRGGGLFKDTIYVDARKGTDLLDIQPFLDLKGATVAEKMVNAGTIQLATQNDLIVNQGAKLDVSGGSITYEAGTIKETNLFYNGNLVPISAAKPDVPYTQVADIYTVKDTKWGTTRGWALGGGGTENWGGIVPNVINNAFRTTVVGGLVDSYLEGFNAGKVDLTRTGENTITNNILIAGKLLANTKIGTQQLIDQHLPSGGELVLSANNLAINKNVAETYAFDAALPDSTNFVSSISSDFAKQGFNKLDFTKVEDLAVNDKLLLKPEGEVKFGRTAKINADVIAPSSNINAVDLTVADGVTISTAGIFTNDNAGVPGQYSSAAAINGGNITATYLTAGKNVKLDTSAGAWVDNKGVLHQGDAGNMDFGLVGDIKTGTQFQAYGFKKNGELSIEFLGTDLNPQTLNIAGNTNASQTDVDIGLGFFNSGAFSKYALSAANVNIGDNAQAAQVIDATQKNWAMNSLFTNLAGGQAMSAVATPTARPNFLPNATSINIRASNPQDGGVLNLAENTTLKTDIGGSVSLSAGKQVNVLGDITTPGGNISLRINDSDVGIDFGRSQMVFIGEKAQLSAVGAGVSLPNSQPNLLNNRIYNAGKIAINQPIGSGSEPQKGAVVIKNGAVLDVSGASVISDTNTNTGFVRETLHGDAGTIAIFSSDAGANFVDGMLLDGTFKGAASGTGRDGTLALTSTTAEFNVTQQKQVRANAYTAGQELDLTDDKAQISVEQVQQGGFANLTIKQTNFTDSIQFENGVDLKLAGNLALDAGLIGVKDNGNVKLAASHVTLKSSNTAVDNTTLTGEGQLSINAKQVFFDGLTAVNGVNKTNITATQDITGKGTQSRLGANTATDGGLVANGEINLTARQVYPSTGSKLRFDAVGENSKITINKSAEAVKPVLAAGGEITFVANDIVQNGNVTAALGQITFDGKNSVKLTQGSITSVSANGQIIPFSTTQTGGEVYDGVISQQNVLLDKAINIKSNNIDLQQNATLDLSAGGDLFAYEFIPGIGGSKDVLAQPNTYAILPTLDQDYAPFDQTYVSSSAQVGVGQSIYLTGIPGLATGNYTLLPARYALVPGALMVQANVTNGGLLPGATVAQLDGSNLTTGYRTDLNTGARDANWSTFKVTDGAIFRPAPDTISKAPSQYLITSATKFFSNPFKTNGQDFSLPTDVARLSLDANKLNLQSNVVATKQAGGDGLKVDISATNMRVVNTQDAADTESLQLTVGSLSALKADSLLLGGSRKLENGVTKITTTAETVSFENNASNSLSQPEIIATASQEISVKNAAVIDTGKGAAKPNKLTLETQGDGSLLALSSLSEISYSRQGGSATSSTGELNVEAGSILKAGNSVVLDATKQANLDGSLSLQDGGSATFGANRILIGNAPTNITGLNVDAATIAALGKLNSLSLNSYNNIDTFGTVNFGNDQLDLSMNAAGIVGHLANGETAAPTNAAPSVITAKNFTLKNTQDATFTAPTDPSGRALEINAATVTFDGDATKTGKVTIDGFSKANINANEIRVAKQGELNFNVAETTLRAGRIAAETASNYQLKSDKKLSILPLANATLAANQSVGAKLNIAAQDLTVGGTIDAASGNLSLTSSNDLTVLNTAKINAASVASTFYNTTEYASAGSVALNSTTGNVNVAAGAVVDVTSKGNTDAGLVKISAANGTANLAGELKGAAAGTGKGGVLDIDVKTLADLTATNNKATGFDEGRQYRVRTGDVAITGTGANALKARETIVSADAGKIVVSGDIIATAPKNSRVGLHAGNGVILESTAKLEAKSTQAGEAGGKVEISTTSDVLDNTPDKLNFKAGSKVDVSGGANGQGGKVKITAPRTLDNSDIEVAQMGTQFVGVKDKVELNALKAYDKTSIETADRTLAMNEAQSFMVSAQTNSVKGLQRLNNAAITITPGVEFRNKTGDLTLPSDWSLYDAKFDPTTGLRVTDATQLASGLNVAGKPLVAGTLNLRASGDVKINGTLSDGFNTAALNLVGQSPTPAQAGTPGVDAVFDADGTEISPAIPEVPAIPAKAGTGVLGLAAWSYNVVAGADFANSKPLSTVAATKDAVTGNALKGNITIANNKGVRTGTGDINLAAGGDLNMGGTGSVIYTAGRQAGELAGFDLPASSNNPLYLTDGGDITISTKGNIKGAESNTNNRQLINNWLFRQGGGDGNKDTSWWVLPHLFRQSLATLGGGDIAINAGGNISSFSASAPTNARFDTNGTSGNQAINGGGDLRVQAGGDINNGVYFVGKGEGKVIAGGSIQKQGNTFGTTLALQEGSFNVKASQNIELAAVINPTLTLQSTANATLSDKTGNNAYFNTYSTAAKVNVASLNGDVAFGTGITPSNVTGLLNSTSETLKYAPAQLNIIAHNGDINMGDTVLMPSPNGDLKVLAADNLTLKNLVMSDADVALLPSIAKPVNQSFIGTGEGKIGGAVLGHAAQLLHQNSTNPVLIVAEKGSINDGNTTPPTLVLPKETKLVAGQQVGNINLVIQNNKASDISLIKAGEDVKVGYVSLAGPGELLVQAGRNIDLSNSKGDISTTGQAANNSLQLGDFSNPNTALPTEGASITLQAGLGKGADVQAYVNRYILPTGAGPATISSDVTRLVEYRANTTKSLTEYMRIKTGNATLTDAEALNGFKTADLETQTIFVNRHLSAELIESAKDFAKAGNHNRGNNAIAALFPQLNQGDILLFASKVTTNSGGSVDMLAPGGLINVGAPGVAFKNPDFQEGDIGIVTEKGGAIRAVADKDFQVNQSKVITQFGSDIAIWSTNGTIDAGRGSKTATSIPERIVQTDAYGNTTIEVRGVASGSGIRAQSYDPDGPNGAKVEPKKGSVFLTAPRVDAGEAGIEAGDLFIVAPIVLNATNIQVQGASSGVPIAASAGVAGAGVSTTPDSVNSAAQAVSQALAQNTNQTFSKPKLPSIISVDVISIGDGQKSTNSADEELKKKQKKPI